MDQFTTANVISGADENRVTESHIVCSSSPVNLESSASPLHSTSVLSDRRWSIPNSCTGGSESAEVVQQCSQSADVLSAKRMSEWETVDCGVVSVQPVTRLIYSGMPSRASPHHNVLPVCVVVVEFILLTEFSEYSQFA